MLALATHCPEWFLATFVGGLSLAVFLSFEPWDAWSFGDIALFQVFGSLIADGQVPYRDFFDHKTPLASYLNAGAAIASDLTGADFVLSARVLSVLMASGASCGLYLLARSASLGRGASLAAAGAYVAFDLSGFYAALGIAPKALVSYVGIFALLAAYRARWFSSGVLCCLAFLAWQPGAVFLVGVGTRALLQVAPNSLLRTALRILAGFSLPLILFLTYLALVGALDEFWTQTFTFNQTYVGGQLSWLPPVELMAERINSSYGSERWLFLLGALGLGLWAVGASAALVRRQRPNTYISLVPVAAVTLGVLSYSFINFTTAGDIIPLLPWVAFWSACLLDSLGRFNRVVGAWIVPIGLAALLVYGHHGLPQRVLDLGSGADRANEARIVGKIEERAGLEPGDPIYVVNESWFLLLSRRDHLSRYHYLRSGVDRFVAEHDGIEAALVDPLLENSPKLVVLSRQPGDWLDPNTYTRVQKIYAPVLRWRYKQLEPKTISGGFSSRAEFWVLLPKEEITTRMELLGQALAAQSFTAEDFSTILGEPQTVSVGIPTARSLAWALDGSGLTEAIGGVELVVPQDISAGDRTLQFSVIVALSEKGRNSQQVTQQLQFERPGNGAEVHTITTSTVVTDVGRPLAGETFVISHFPGTAFEPGERIRISVRRTSGHPDDTYPHDLYILGIIWNYSKR